MFFSKNLIYLCEPAMDKQVVKKTAELGISCVTYIASFWVYYDLPSYPDITFQEIKQISTGQCRTRRFTVLQHVVQTISEIQS